MPDTTPVDPDPVSQWEDDGGAAVYPGEVDPAVNVGAMERMLSAYVGASLMTWGASRRNVLGLLTMIVGGGFLYRAASGHCVVYDALKFTTANRDAPRRSVESGTTPQAKSGSATAQSSPTSVSAPIAAVVEHDRELAMAPMPTA